MAKQTKGFCKYCGKEYTKSSMIKHLAVCKERKVIFENVKEKTAYYELVLYGKYDKSYWLIIQIKETATLKDLDQFIRDIWVECCGHLSAFNINGQRYETMPERDIFWGEPAKSMNYKLKNVFEPGMQMEYEYDYGSTTELIISVQDYYHASSQREKISILSRNNPPEILCSICGKNIASWVNPEGFYDDNPYWCEECFVKQEEGEIDSNEEEGDYDFEPAFMLPVCNSPRMGVCGYEGSDKYPEQFQPDKKQTDRKIK